MSRIIGVCGYKGSGKSEVAKYLIEKHNFVRFPFAAPLKQMLITLGLTQEDVDGADKEKPSKLLGGKTPRWAMQTLGTEWGRKLIDHDLWARAWDHNRQQPVPFDIRKRDIVVDDLRFYNEAKILVDAGAILWKVDRASVKPVSPWWRRLLRLGPKVHVSEKYIGTMPVHFIVDNNADLKQLYANIEHRLDVSFDSILKDSNARRTKQIQLELEELDQQ